MEELYILPFDHRSSFMKIIKASSPPTKADIEKASNYKKIIYEAFKKSIKEGIPKKNAGILVDEWLGKEILKDAKKNSFITATPLEKSGQDEFDFEFPNFKEKIQELDTTYIKVLVRYNPEGDKTINKRQTKRLSELTIFLKTRKNKFLFELLVPATDEQLKKAGSQEAYEQKLRPKLMVIAIKELQQAGINPDIWKIEGLDSTKDMQKVANQVLAGNKNSRIIILGRGESTEKAEHWLRMGAKVKNAIGFAVGRTVFLAPLEELAKGEITREQAINKICNNYKFFVNIWRKVKSE